MEDHLINHPGLIIGFGIAVLIMLLLDLGVFNKNAHIVSNKEALTWSVVWISLAMIFSGVVYFVLDKPQGITDNFSKFQAAYWIEKALSVDNLFVFILVFKFFKIPKEYQHKVLFCGIDPETGLSRELNVVLFVFGIFLIGAGIKSWSSHDGEEEESKDLNKNIGVRIVHRFFKVSSEFSGDKFFVVKQGVKYATPL